MELLNLNDIRLCVDYCQTIKIYIDPDIYPLPRIDDIRAKLAKYKCFSTFNLKNAYYQVRIKQSDRKYTIL